MGTPSEDTTDEVSSGKLQQNLDPDSGTNKSESKEKGNCQPMSAEVVSGELQKRLSPDEEAQASKSNREESADPITCQEVSSEVKLSQHDKGIGVSVSNQEDSSLSRVNEKQSEHVHQKQGLASETDASEFSQVSILPKEASDEKSYGSESGVKDEAVSLLSGKASDPSHQLQSQKMEVFVSQSDQQEAYSIRPEKALDKLQPRRNLDTSVHGLPSDQGSAPSRAPEKPSEDGYNWRKYGQKLVRGNEFTRSYYKCTYSNCLAKKQVERSQDGHITDIHYIGNHEHPRPLNSPQISPEFVVPLQMRRSDMPIINTSEAEGTKSTVLGATCQRIEPSEAPLALEIVSAGGGLRDSLLKPHKLGDEVDKNGSPDSKRQKKDVAGSDDTPPIKSHSEPRHIVETMCEVDIVNDGYRWRKYGQKIVKGNPNPRSYYRCSSTGCRAKKHVERASHNPKLVITTYEGKHDHDTPTSRTIIQNSAGTDCNTTGISGESRSESGETKHVSLDMVVHIGAN